MAAVEPIVANRRFGDLKTARAVQVHIISKRRFADRSAVNEARPVFGKQVAVAHCEFSKNIMRVLPVADRNVVDSECVLKEIRYAACAVQDRIERSHKMQPEDAAAHFLAPHEHNHRVAKEAIIAALAASIHVTRLKGAHRAELKSAKCWEHFHEHGRRVWLPRGAGTFPVGWPIPQVCFHLHSMHIMQALHSLHAIISSILSLHSLHAATGAILSLHSHLTVHVCCTGAAGSDLKGKTDAFTGVGLDINIKFVLSFLRESELDVVMTRFAPRRHFGELEGHARHRRH